MRLLPFAFMVVLSGLLLGSGSKAERPVSKNAKETDSGSQSAEETRQTDPTDKPRTNPEVDSRVAVDRVLDRKKAKRLQVRHSMIGFRNTLLFYTFNDQQAILTLSIGNTDESFPVKGRIHLFDDATTEEGLKKWINNQHSDALFREVPTPIFTGELPEGSCRVTSHKQTGTSKNPTSLDGNPEVYRNYEVKLSVKEYTIDKKARLSAFTDTATVHVKSK